ncbi:MAG: hypothetical protein Q7T22_12515 [Serpentinimonas sp.]|jgi:hypothetical protein|nr:hypothetical protein [Serpentinimonas sp.]MDO9611094.1 hypothetical protein [Serpentinimonas sp.]
MTEILFIAQAAPTGGYTARAVGHDIYTEADTLPGLHEMLRDAVRCHFDEGLAPSLIRLQLNSHPAALRHRNSTPGQSISCLPRRR